jgi:putative oxidoreductase
MSQKAAPQARLFSCNLLEYSGYAGVWFGGAACTANERDQFLALSFWRSQLCLTGDDMDQTFSKFQPIVLSLFRFMTGLLLFQYGCAKILKIPAESPFAKVQLMSLYGAAGSIELILGGLLMIGLFTRPVAFILSGEMAFAYFIGHYPKGFFPVVNGGTAAILFCFACLYLSTTGGGPYSVDAAMGKKS